MIHGDVTNPSEPDPPNNTGQWWYLDDIEGVLTYIHHQQPQQ